jgi:exonuclease III
MLSRTKTFQVSAIAIALSSIAFSASTFAQSKNNEVGIASFNIAWASTKADFKTHLAVCSAPEVNWCDTRPRIARGATEPTKEEADRAKQCQNNIETAAGGFEKSMLVAPCNAYRLNASNWTMGETWYDEKMAGLTSTVDKLITEQGIGIMAFQEVKSRDTIQAILGKHVNDFDTCVAEHNAFQTVGFAWRKSLSAKPAQCKSEEALAIKDNEEETQKVRKLRPGLELKINIGGVDLSVLNVHLKSSCANLITTDRYPGHVLTDDDKACKILNRQVAPLENWIERVAAKTPLFVLLGDFNRRLDEEAASNPAKDQVRSDGSDPASPNPVGTRGEVQTRLMWQEISDGNPGLVQVPLAEGTGACKGFVGLDHILLSEALNAKQTGGASSVKVGVDQLKGQKIISSDHCPRITTLKLR